MCMLNRVLIGALLLTALPVQLVAGAETPMLGKPLAPENAGHVDLTVLPDGAGLPPGAGSARDGELIYQQHCQACHGPRGQGGPNDRLAGGQGSLLSTQPVKTIGSYWPYATTVFDYVRRAMPYTSPGILSNDEVYAVTAYLLHINGLIGIDEPINASTLPGVVMPNAANFISRHPETPGAVSVQPD